MRKIIIIPILAIIAISGLVYFSVRKSYSGAPPYAIEDLEPPPSNSFEKYKNWERPDGPPKVGLQVGHWKSSELPDELARIRGNTGASGGGKSEWEVNYKIAELTSDLLKGKGVEVEILPATIPPNFWADVFIAIHADGNLDSSVKGFKIASPRRDYTQTSGLLTQLIQEEYQKSTGLEIDPNVSRNMRGYYAFAWWRYEHSVHPMTTSAILETGFLTSPADRKILINNPQTSASGLFSGIIKYLEEKGLINEES